MIRSLDELPAVAAYLGRIGAEPVNFKTANITVQSGGYPRVIGSVSFGTNGSVRCSGAAADRTPTPEEQEAITEAFATAELPKIVTLAAIDEGPEGVNLNDPNVFVCHDFDGNIIMIHQRYETKKGEKGFIPWTRWSDGQWRMMEPEVMPFYGLPGFKDHATLFIHEGSKAARAVKEIIAGDRPSDRFPWLEEMRWAHHIGWIGGVHALARSDWEKLAAQGWKRVVIVADNDPLGKNIVPRISRFFSCETFALIFNDSWPETFDLGDDWPDNLFGEAGQYLGPVYEDCLEPATFATDQITLPPEGRGRPRVITTIRPSFANQWAWIESQDVIVNMELPRWKMRSSSFDKWVRPFSDVNQTAALIQSRYAGSNMVLTYDPSNVGRRIKAKTGHPAINLFQPAQIKPLPGDWAPWTEFLEYLVPDPSDRHSLARWCATLIARPDIRMIFGVLLMSEVQGIGKTTLGTVLADLVGRTNASFPGESLIVGSEFNGWMANKRLIVVNEIYSGHSWKAYNKLKPFVTDADIEINIKFEPTYTQPNWCHFLLCSNSLAALRLEDKDRRWLVPRIIETPWPRERFVALYDWLRDGGLAHIAYWAATFEKRGEGKYILPGEIAPMSAAKQSLIVESRSEAEQLWIDLGDHIKTLDAPVAISLTWLRDWAKERLERDKVFETPQGIGRLFRKRGFWITDRVKIAGGYHVMVVNREEMATWEPARLREIAKKPEDLMVSDF